MGESAEGFLLRHARLESSAPPQDLLVCDGRLEFLRSPRRDLEVIDLDGRLVLPGLWDAHVHFDQWAAAKRRLDLSGVRSAAELTALVAKRLAGPPQPADTVLLGYGFRDGLWPDIPTTALLDTAAPDVPVVMVSGDLHSAWLNTVALQRFGRAGHTGLLREDDWLPIMSEIARVPDAISDVWAAEAASDAAARGVVGIVDFEAPDSAVAWTRRIVAGGRNLRVVCSVWPTRLDAAIDRGLRSGDRVPGTGGLATVGPLKVITDGSLNTRTAYCHDPYPGMEGQSDACGVLSCPPEQLVPLMQRAWAAGLETSIHAIGDLANSLVLDAFETVGSRGTIEHAQLLDPDDFARFAALGITASVQPEHAVDDRDVADHHWAGRTDRAFAYGGLFAAGAELALGSDAPVAPLDPWISIAAAVSRTRDDRPSWHPEQELPVGVALSASARGRATLRTGDVADLVVLDADPFTTTAAQLRVMPVAGTLLGGRWTHRAGL